MVDAKITLDSTGKLHFPALILYEESMQSDIIKVRWKAIIIYRISLRTPHFLHNFLKY